MEELTDSRIDRYARQILLPGIGASGQIRLLRARVDILLADPALRPAAELCAIYLARAGVGRLAGSSLEGRLKLHNPDVTIERSLPGNADTRVLFGRELPETGLRPLVWGWATAAEARWTHLRGGEPGCPRCLEPWASGPPPSPATAAVLGCALALETLRSLADLPPPVSARLHRFTPSSGARCFAIALPRRSPCPDCDHGEWTEPADSRKRGGFPGERTDLP